MSRTYRKRNHWQTDQEYIVDFKSGSIVKRLKNKADIAKEKSDNGPFRNTHTKWWMKQISRKGRRVSTEQFAKLNKTSQEDLEYFDFDDSKYTKMRKGIWWIIY